MSLQHFYLPPEAWDDEVSLKGQEARHLGQVLRLGPGAEVILLDGRGRTGCFSVLGQNKKEVRLRRLTQELTPRPVAGAVMALAFSKATRRGFFMEKAVELGVQAIWLWQGDHSQGKVPADAEESWQGQLLAGAKQCGNAWLPEVRVLRAGITELVHCAAVLDYRILPWEAQSTLPLLSPDLAGRPGQTAYVIGPEGGFSAHELACLNEGGFMPVSLGARVLRCETAATLCLGLHWWASQLPGRADAPRSEQA